ncbi:hypothetical protein [Occallatibacter savannae]|uniref:hypothetical protein n=1 Tax=Occallatibacter savannae TaxID=1002691 RepID=UPI0013A5B261|nr:hypothetical protein [Occallatibacter savannae]
MPSFYQFQSPRNHQLLADPETTFKQWEYRSCPAGGTHPKSGRRIGPLHYTVKHNNREEHIIWGPQITVHVTVVERLEREGFTGFRTQPARVSFLDGGISDQYKEFTVTGWAGVVRPESGMRVLESCSGCLWKNYGPIADFDNVIDWDQWTGEDFFFVWPLTGHRLCTERAAKWLEVSGIRSFCLGQGFESLQREKRSLNFGIPRGPLSSVLPEDLAIKYGKSLGLE